MTPDLLETLLHQNESESLDFKVAQYQFDGATTERQSELLKDILAFINAWRQTDAYILIGIEEARDARSQIRGVDAHLLNRNLQQFVTSKTNRAPVFSYSVMKTEDVEVGVIHIPIQDRPVFLTKDFGRLRANTVYIRRGDTTGEASPDEVLRMASVAGPLHTGQPVLDFEFGEPKSRVRLGMSPPIEVVSSSVPSPSKIPDYGAPAEGGYWAPALSMENRNFIRDTAAYLKESTFLKPIAIVVDNVSTSLAEDVLIKIRIEGKIATARTTRDMPHKPSTDRTLALVRPRAAATKTSVNEFDDHWEVVIEIGNVQPGTTVWSVDPFFVGARAPGLVEATIKISANNLRIPQTLDAQFDIQVEERSFSAAEVRNFAKLLI